VWRKRVQFSWTLFTLAAVTSWFLLLRGETVYLAPLPVASVTVFLGLLNPPRTILVAGADYSYGIYLYGFSVQQALVYLFPETRIWYVNFIFSLFVAGGYAFLSWNLVESKIHRKRKDAVQTVTSSLKQIASLSKATISSQHRGFDVGDHIGD
jgi:peptidoglycan/LPS O-acetylase OafA/YrhL